MTYLVVGADRVDAGKTTFAAGLVHRLGTTGFKPRAGNDFWFDHDDVRDALAAGRLYGKDAARLAGACPDGVTPEAVNPVHRLWRPVTGSGGVLGREGRAFVVDRIGGAFVVNATVEVPDVVSASLPLADAPRVSSIDGLNELTRERYLPRLDALEGTIEGVDDAVVESYGNVATPLRDLSADRVAVVEPGRVRVFGGERYARACEASGGRPADGRLEARVPDVVEPLAPEAVVALPPLRHEARTEPAAVAVAYAEAYDAVTRNDGAGRSG